MSDKPDQMTDVQKQSIKDALDKFENEPLPNIDWDEFEREIRIRPSQEDEGVHETGVRCRSFGCEGHIVRDVRYYDISLPWNEMMGRDLSPAKRREETLYCNQCGLTYAFLELPDEDVGHEKFGG